MSFSRVFLKAANGVVSFVTALCLLLAGAYAAYALWDNSQIYTAAQDVQAEMQKLKPVLEEAEDGGASFAELLAVNGDVCAWLTLDNTGVDYPILQGTDNLSYINTDVYGQFALAGSIFLDSRNDSEFHDDFSLLYGHHMSGGRMFGDLDLYKEEDFFRENRTGLLLLPDRAYDLEIFAYLLLPASEDAIFEPQQWNGEIGGLLRFAEENAQQLHRDVLQRLMGAQEPPQILGMSTCASEFTDARTILLAHMVPHVKPDA